METKKPASPVKIILILSSVFFVFFIGIAATLFMFQHTKGGELLAKKGVKSGGAGLFGGNAVGVIELNGVIMDSKKIIKQLDQFEEASEVAGVVLRINSPGGSVAPSQEIYERVRAFTKPLAVSMGSVAASGGYYIACGAKRVFANAGTITGSIGVIMSFANLEKLYDWAKVKRYSIKTGRYKDAGADYRDMSSDERALLQGMVDDVLVQFKRAVMDGRKMSSQSVDAVADGRILSGSQAKQAKLVDELGTLQDTIEYVAKEAKIKGKPRVVYPGKKQPSILQYLMQEGRDSDEDAESSTEFGSGLVGLLKQWGGVAQTLSEGTRALSGMRGVPGIYWLWDAGH